MPSGGAPETGCATGEAMNCSDGIDCTTDRCDPRAGCLFQADHTQCNDQIECTEDRCSTTEGCTHLPNDDLCNDGFCFTGGTCDTRDGCRGSAQRSCSDMDMCTTDRCDAAAQMCVHSLVDADGDGFTAASVGPHACGSGTDCNDGDAAINPDATEVCANNLDDNCNGQTDEGCGGPDTCASALSLELHEGSAHYEGPIDELNDDLHPGCDAQEGGRDAVFALSIPGGGAVDVRIDTNGSSFDTVLAVAQECSVLGSDEAVCNDDQIPREERASRIWIHRIPPSVGPRPLFILVDAFSAVSSGMLRLNVEVSAAAGDGCATPMDISGGGTVLGFLGALSGAAGALTGTCQGFDDVAAAEIVFRYRPVRPEALFVARSADFLPDLYVRRTCLLRSSEVGCSEGRRRGGQGEAELMVRHEVETAHFAIVDGARSAGTYVLEYQPQR